jgi:glucokinase
VANLSVILNPSMIVFGGSIGINQSLFQNTRRILERNELAATRLAVSLLGGEAQLYGAVRLALDRAEAKLLG